MEIRVFLKINVSLLRFMRRHNGRETVEKQRGFLLSLAVQNDSSDHWRTIVGPNGWMVHSSTWDKEYFEQAEIKVHY